MTFLETKLGRDNEDKRTAWVTQQLKNLKPGQLILDVGAGLMPFKKFCSHLKYQSHDFAKYDGVGDGRSLQVTDWKQNQLDIVADITEMPVKDGYFDAVLCTEVLEHVPDPVLALKEICRIVRPGGQIILTVPFISFSHFTPYFFATGFSEYFFKKHLTHFGFDKIEITFNGDFFSLLSQEIIRLPDVLQRYAPQPVKYGLLDKVLFKLARYRIESHAAKTVGSAEFACHGVFVRATKSQ